MLKAFLEAAEFTSRWRAMGLGDDDLRALQNQLMERPEAGVTEGATGGLQKARFAPAKWGRGKSGAVRVCYVHLADLNVIALVTVFGKGKQATLTPEDKKRLRPKVDQVKREARERSARRRRRK